ncbi:hypothetical protein [Phenylobacterium sp.]|uniref:hypothetical protein n=1 Tax=Phenylobacterium sp. TaxID=1871053 RepID=UPI002601101D|nr:hypothetical protein [Phenylobacterium sp.]
MTDRDDEADALAAALTGMFRQFEARPVPEHIQRVVDQLDAAAAGEAIVRPTPPPTSSPEP